MTSKTLKKQAVSPRNNVGITQAKPPQLQVATVIPEMKEALVRMAEAVSLCVAPQELATVRRELKSYEGAIDGMRSVVDNQLKKTVLEKGTLKEGTVGTIQVQLTSGQYLQARPSRTGYDPKKFEAKLRSMGLNPEVAMQPEVKYVMNLDKFSEAVGAKKLKREDFEDCMYDTTYSIHVLESYDD